MKLWNAETGRLVRDLKGHTDRVFSVAFSPDGKRLFAGVGNGTVLGWSAETGEKQFVLKGHSLPVNSVVLSVDGERILTSAGDHLSSGKPGEVKFERQEWPGASLAPGAHSRRDLCGVEPRRNAHSQRRLADAVKLWETGRGQRHSRSWDTPTR